MKTIKNIFKSKITYAVLACLLLVGIFAGLTTLASNDPIVTIESKNINHAESARLVYRVKIANVTEQELINNAGALKMHFWTTEPAAPNAAPEYTVVGVTDGEDATGAYALFESYDIAPKAMTNSVYCAAEYNGVYSDVCRYSVFEYLCEASMTANADQKALYTAMNDYIKYAQMYLGVDGDEFPSVDKLAYIKLTNAYILVNGEQVRDGVVPLKTYIVYSDFEYARYKNYKGSPCEFADGHINTWNAGFSSTNKVLGYTAYEGGQITFDPVENTKVVRVEVSANKQSGKNWAVVKTYEGAGKFVLTNEFAHGKDNFVVVPVEPDGKVFSHWEIDGNKVSDSYMYSINDNTELVIGESVAAVMPTPVFVDANAFGLNTIAKGTSSTTAITDLYDDDGNLIGFTNVKTGAGGGQSTNLTGVLADGTTVVNRIRLTETIKIDSAAGNYNKPPLTDFFSETDFLHHYQNYFKMGDQMIMTYAFIASADSGKSNGYYITLSDYISDNTTSFSLTGAVMQYGVENTVDFILELGQKDGKYEITNIIVYVNGNFAGATAIHSKNAPTFDYANNLTLQTITVERTISTITVTNATVECK